MGLGTRLTTKCLSIIHQTEFPAVKCIDGDTEGHSLVDRNMCHTQNEPSPWLAIDYGTIVTVTKVEIFNREACCGESTKNVDVRVSNELPTSANTGNNDLDNDL